ncbi:MAG: ATP-binding protein [Methylocystis silviterrae]|uniref:ATP-binding protein n=1 Tax=Methylocystis silviterrae TaxID=2743612 RepID=UPI003C77E5B1
MTTKTFEIQVQDDHLQRIAQVRKPVLAVAELIWNAVDADADRVDVTLQDNNLGGLSAIEVGDNGHGIPYANAEQLFSRLGGSWKQGGHKSQEKGRILHGKEGRGRFRAFSLGRVVDWHVCYGAPDGLRAYRITMLKDHLKRVQVEDEARVGKGFHRGTQVVVSELDKQFRSLRDPATLEELAQIFALYLRQYPNIKIYYDGTLINPRSVEDHAKEYSLPEIEAAEDEKYPVKIEIVEWKIATDRRMYFCDGSGFPLEDAPPGIHAPGFNFTAYLKSDYFAKLLAENRLEIASLDAQTAKVLEAAKEVMRSHFRRRASERAAGLVEEWKREEIYPYEGQPATPIEEVERQVFNVVALNVSNYLPNFQESDEKTKRLQLRLLRNAVENAPADLSKILTEVLDLPPEKRQELADLLDRTTLAHIISASKIIADRLEFLKGLETLVFDKEFKYAVRERTQLHRVVAENTWMFGEQYHLSVDDQSLTEVLKKHILSQGREIEIDEPVKRLDGTRGIVDLMFSRNIQIAGSQEREHLIVELKRPDVKIDADALTQLKSYAFAVMEDERFRDVQTKWVFWAVSSDLNSYARHEISQRDRPHGMLHQAVDPSCTIWVKTWSQIINDCRSRLQFFAEKLNYTPDRDSSLEHLKTTYHRYLAELFTPQTEDAQKEAAD